MCVCVSGRSKDGEVFVSAMRGSDAVRRRLVTSTHVLGFMCICKPVHT